MGPDLRPLSLGELLDRAFSLYRSHFRTLVAIMGVPAAFGASIGLLRQVSNAAGFTSAAAGAPSPAGALLVIAIGLVFLVLFAVSTVIYAVAGGATAAAVSDLYMGRQISAREAYRRVSDRVGRLLLVTLLVGMRIGALVLVTVVIVVILLPMTLRSTAPWAAGSLIALVLLIAIPLLVFLTLRYALVVPAVAIEPITARDALDRSVELTRGGLRRTLVVMAFGMVIAYIAAILFEMPFAMAAIAAGPLTPAGFWLTTASGLFGALASAITSPLMIVALALLYYDMRVRHEGLDLDVMLQSLDDSSGSPVAPATLSS